MGNRFLGLSKIVLWLGWLGFAAVLAAGPFRWEMDYFLIHGNRVYYRAMLGLLVLLGALCLGYVPLRRGLGRWELPLITAFAFCFAALEQPAALFVGLLLFTACFSTGHRLARLFGIKLDRPAEVLGLGFSIGCAAWLPVLFVLGLFGAYYRGVAWLLVLAPLALWPRDAWASAQAIGKLYQSARASAGLRHPLCGIAMIFLAAGVFFGVAAALPPSIAFDSVNMHLPAVQYYSAQHSLRPVPHLAYSYYPQGFETLVTVAYQLGGQAAAQFVPPVFFVAFLLVLFAAARECELDLAAILTGFACLVMTPFIVWGGTQIKNDTALAMFQLATLLCYLRWRNSGERAWLLLGAALLASSFAMKHVALFGAIPLILLFAAALDWKGRWLRTAGAFVLLLGALSSYWQVRAFAYTGNPVYPERLGRVQSPVGKPGQNKLVRFVELPWRLHFEGQRAELTYQGFESPLRSPLGLALITFAPMTLLAPWRRSANRRACIFYVAVYLLYWGAVAGILRYALAPIALLMVLVAGKAKDAFDQHWTAARGAVRVSIAAALAGSLAFGLLGVILVVSSPGEFAYLAHRIGRNAYLAANLPEYRSLQAFGRLDRRAAVFTVDACSRAYAPDPAAFACSSAGNARIEEELKRGAYQFVAIPATKEQQRAAILEGWNAEQVYRDDNYVGYRISQDR